MSILVAAAVAAQLAATETAVAEPQSPTDTVIVTGTRFSGLRAKDSLDPVQVVDGAALEQAARQI